MRERKREEVRENKNKWHLIYLTMIILLNEKWIPHNKILFFDT